MSSNITLLKPYVLIRGKITAVKSELLNRGNITPIKHKILGGMGQRLQFVDYAVA